MIQRYWRALNAPSSSSEHGLRHSLTLRPPPFVSTRSQHMVRGRTTAPAGLVLGHEITGEVVECGSDVEFVKKGDIVSVPFNVGACC